MMWIIFLAVEKDEKKFEYIFRKKRSWFKFAFHAKLTTLRVSYEYKNKSKKEKKRKSDLI